MKNKPIDYYAFSCKEPFGYHIFEFIFLKFLKELTGNNQASGYVIPIAYDYVVEKGFALEPKKLIRCYKEHNCFDNFQIIQIVRFLDDFKMRRHLVLNREGEKCKHI